MTAPLEPDRGLIETFVNALFPHAGTEGYISLRAFTEGNNKKIPLHPDRAWWWSAVRHRGRRG